MEKTEELFFELIRVAIGTSDSLSHIPSSKEWKALFDMAKKQSLIGVCFAALQRLGADADEGFARIGMSEIQYLTWMGVTAKIKLKNEALNQRCVELQAKLSVDGFRSCILKGQGVAALYRLHDNDNHDLSGLRQSGDIDVWVEGGMAKVMQWVRKYNPEAVGDYVHTHMNIFDETEVEVHYRYGLLYNLRMNRKLQKWFEVQREFEHIEMCGEQITVPSAQFNAIYLMLHTYRHLFASGVGLRQVMDYYFLLKSRGRDIDTVKFNKEIDQFGLRRFAGALIWVIKTVLVGHDDDNDDDNFFLGIEANEEEGRYLLNLIMEGGNFGHAKKNTENHSHNGAMINMMRHSAHLALHYGHEALWAPIWHVYHFFWKRL